ncbi:hypothetical protein A2943_00140 [Candidatus Adlerbacteria bacterium RIFCSPLOWO2_01_FULL_51_16]|uniref:Glycosyltransferase 2-like domain-containing protein n=1 Tax=Candidatus Adlerbacteria bacterium RIFCSPLOWO2_01_FULL_51_16 TaxID=1797243 RepID=A0A1F4XF34_9BACT|nr:MAG: hypothetical protein A2943_00140 [Candidatus Adlerbacteria bacterium RIFCSPLOWO2_01_FULL_51_16]
MNNQGKKIPCSVSLLTLNSARGLSACLESLKDFEEIIVCDGNSSDATQNIARAFGARVIKQYDTDEPETPCAMDKARVRERAMSSSTLPWRFFMDSDDTLSKEAVEEIRTIVSDSNPKHFVWRMPTRIFIDGREIKHEATYPSYQTRLVHERVGAHFRGPVHERLAFDEKKFPIGEMQNFYNFHWPRERVERYWDYLHTYAKRELQTAQYGTLSSFLYWSVYRRIKTILGYLLWRLPAMYLRWGFKNSMPLSIELTIVRYHLYVLFGDIKNYFATRAWYVLFVETLRGKDLNRILGNLAVCHFEAYGRVLDVGGDGHASYWRFLGQARWHNVTTLDIDPKAKPDFLVDLEKGDLPFPDNHFDTALLFNVLEHVHNRERLLRNIRRVLRRDGTLLGIVPFLVGVHPSPHDYTRLTGEGLMKLFKMAGFVRITISPIGRGPLCAAYAQTELILPRIFKLFLLPLILGLDALVLAARPAWREKFPLSYAFSVR